MSPALATDRLLATVNVPTDPPSGEDAPPPRRYEVENSCSGPEAVTGPPHAPMNMLAGADTVAVVSPVRASTPVDVEESLPKTADVEYPIASTPAVDTEIRPLVTFCTAPGLVTRNTPSRTEIDP